MAEEKVPRIEVEVTLNGGKLNEAVKTISQFLETLPGGLEEQIHHLIALEIIYRMGLQDLEVTGEQFEEAIKKFVS